jgi:ribosome-associated toxin RatA of RatAB toxin-antitoxin module
MADKTSSTMTIEAPPPVIMAVIADFTAYPQWASGVRSAEILQTGQDGRAERVRFTIDAGVIKDSYVLGYTWEGDEHVRWDLVERGSAVSEMSGAYRLDQAGDATKVTYELAVGLAIPMIGMLKRRAEKTIIDTALKGLRGRVQQTAGESGDGR